MTAITDHDLLDAILRQDFASFVHKAFGTVSPGDRFLPNWHIKAIAWHLTEVRDGRIKRLLITMPPRYLKSICASVAFPAWILGHDPTREIVCVSYATDLSKKFANDCRAVMSSEWYRRIFPRTRLDPNKNAETEFKTTARGGRFTTSVGGTLTERGGNLVIIDDPMKATDAQSEVERERVKQWFSNTLLSRLNNKTQDAIIVVMQRLHVDDLAGVLLEQDGWTHLDIPAIAEEDQNIPIGPNSVHERKAGDVLQPKREPLEKLDEAKATLGSMNFSAQYQQRPVPLDGNLVKWAWFKIYDHLPPANKKVRFVQSWDTASKAGELNDYSVCTTWMQLDGHHYLMDVLRERLEYPALKKKAVQMAQRYNANIVLLEDKGSGTQLCQDLQQDMSLRRGHYFSVLARPVDADKVTRMSNQLAIIEEGRVHIPRDIPWLAAFKIEMLSFPGGRHDDQVDSVSQYLNWVQSNWRPIIRSRRTIGM